MKNKIKRIVALLLTVLLVSVGHEAVLANTVTASTVTANTVTATPTNADVLINGIQHNLASYNIQGQVYVRLSDLAIALTGTIAQFNLIWDQTAVIIPGEAYTPLTTRDIHTHAGVRQAVARHSVIQYRSAVSGNPWWGWMGSTDHDFHGYSIDNVNFFALNDIADTIGFDTNWDPARGIITIDTNRSHMPDHVRIALEEFLSAKRGVFIADSFAFVQDVFTGGNWVRTDIVDPVTGVVITPEEIARRPYLIEGYVASGYLLHDINNSGIPEVIVLWSQTWEGCYGGFAEVFSYVGGAFRSVGTLMSNLVTDSQNRLIMVDNGDLGDEFHRIYYVSLSNGTLELSGSDWAYGNVFYPNTVTTPLLPGEILTRPRSFRSLEASLSRTVIQRLRAEGRL